MNWIKSHKFEAHAAVLGLMLIPSVALYLTAQQNSHASMLLWLGLFIIGNLFALFIK